MGCTPLICPDKVFMPEGLFMNFTSSRKLALPLIFVLCQPVFSAPVSLSDLRVGTISIRQSEASVVQGLGEPDYRAVTGYGLVLSYPDLAVGMTSSGGRVRQLETSSSRQCLPSKVCPKTPISGAIRAYGRPTEDRRGDPQNSSDETGMRYIKYLTQDKNCSLFLPAKHGVIQSILIECDDY